MIPNNNLSVLPFYSSVEKQNHRKDYAYGEVYPLLTLNNKILPFQIIRSTRTNSTLTVKVRKENGAFVEDISSQMISSGININRYESEGYDVIIHNSYMPMAITYPEGRYYLEISDGVETFYSEIFVAVYTLEGCIKLEYWDKESLFYTNGKIDFSTGFKFCVYLPTQIGRPDYEFEEQVENRDGYSFVEKQVSEKTFKFNFLAPEYLCDALRIVRMMDYIRITSKGETYIVDTFLITPKWQDGGHLAAVEAEFQCDTVIKKIAKGYYPEALGDYNIDHNTDYLKTL